MAVNEPSISASRLPIVLPEQRILMNDIPAVFGFDPSLSKFGLSDGDRHEVISTSPDTPLFDRATKIVQGVARFITRGDSMLTPKKMLWVKEGPLLRPGNTGWLLERGYLDARLDLYAHELRCGGMQVETIEILGGSLKKWAFEKGNAHKDDTKLLAFEKFGVKIDNDPGANKLDAYLLYRYGIAVLNGSVKHVPAATRGHGRRTVAARRQKKDA